MSYRFMGLALAFSFFAATLSGCGNESACTEHEGVFVCGDFGEALFSAPVSDAAGPIGWPPVAMGEDGVITTRGTDLVRITKSGSVIRLARFQSQLLAASRGPDGTIYVAGADGSKGVLKAYVDGAGTGTVQWSSGLAAPSVGVPASIGGNILHVATMANASHPALHDVDATTGKLVRTRAGASPAAVLLDGSLRYVVAADGKINPATQTPLFTRLKAEKANGDVAWSHDEPKGVTDFAPGPDGETYLVTTDHRLVKVGPAGQVKWTYSATCERCTVAAAPTVTRDAIYFPVWEERPGMITDMNGNNLDPLFVLTPEGKLLWQYDGFSLRKSHYSTDMAMLGVESKQVEVITHHPAGRPVVAQGGISYVAADGAVVALDAKGNELGRVIYDQRAGEITAPQGGGSSFTWINPGVTPSPALASDGTLYVWDGSTVRGFATDHKLMPSSWTAPFGGPDNDGRIQ